MAWSVEVHEHFALDLEGYEESVRLAIAVEVGVLEMFGPQLGRPHVDTLIGSVFTNMKELRCNVDKQVWRIAFAFDPDRKAILLTAGDKRGQNQKRFYTRLINDADSRFLDHLSSLKKTK